MWKLILSSLPIVAPMIVVHLSHQGFLLAAVVSTFPRFFFCLLIQIWTFLFPLYLSPHICICPGEQLLHYEQIQKQNPSIFVRLETLSRFTWVALQCNNIAYCNWGYPYWISNIQYGETQLHNTSYISPWCVYLRIKVWGMGPGPSLTITISRGGEVRFALE